MTTVSDSVANYGVIEQVPLHHCFDCYRQFKDEMAYKFHLETHGRIVKAMERSWENNHG